MKCVQLNIEFEPQRAQLIPLPSQVNVSDVKSDVEELDAVANRQGLGSLFKNPCLSCMYRDLCAADECGMKMYPLDMDKAPTFGGAREECYWNTYGVDNDLLDFD